MESASSYRRVRGVGSASTWAIVSVLCEMVVAQTCCGVIRRMMVMPSYAMARRATLWTVDTSSW